MPVEAGEPAGVEVIRLFVLDVLRIDLQRLVRIVNSAWANASIMLKSSSSVGHPSGATLTVVLPAPAEEGRVAVQGTAAAVVVTSPCTRTDIEIPERAGQLHAADLPGEAELAAEERGIARGAALGQRHAEGIAKNGPDPKRTAMPSGVMSLSKKYPETLYRLRHLAEAHAKAVVRLPVDISEVEADALACPTLAQRLVGRARVAGTAVRRKPDRAVRVSLIFAVIANRARMR